MNSKEMIALANTLILEFDDPPDCECFTCAPARYVLATVREDDDELLFSSWLVDHFSECQDIEEMTYEIMNDLYLVLESGAWILYIGGYELGEMKTRGQLRKLISALKGGAS